ncbi:hypothetical protein [Sporosarcina sp. NCCP-2222]|uniref:hypothetical protein n=1 Tax=Sporosarcina sp. NCCP-2222 TaxID=2935073 RepID=UPI0020C08DB3|nr:hypothetical protein [Sporosarcina sp. NCCP-2222]
MFRLSGVQFVILAFVPVIWRSIRYSGVRTGYLAFNSLFWRSFRLSGVHLELLAFARSYWRSSRYIGIHPPASNKNALTSNKKPEALHGFPVFFTP